MKHNEPMIACPACGEMNRIASPFCKSCGGRIYRDGAAPLPENTSRNRSGGFRAFRNAVNALFFVALVVMLGLALWPYRPQTPPRGQGQAGEVERYLQVVTNAKTHQQALAPYRITEGNLNAYLGQNNDGDRGRYLGVLLSAPNLELTASEPLGPLYVSTRLSMKPAEGSRRRPVVSEFWVGHLPLPAVLAKPWTRSLAGRFDLELPPAVWEDLTLEGVDRGSVLVGFAP